MADDTGGAQMRRKRVSRASQVKLEQSSDHHEVGECDEAEVAEDGNASNKRRAQQVGTPEDGGSVPPPNSDDAMGDPLKSASGRR